MNFIKIMAGLFVAWIPLMGIIPLVDADSYLFAAAIPVAMLILLFAFKLSGFFWSTIAAMSCLALFYIAYEYLREQRRIEAKEKESLRIKEVEKQNDLKFNKTVECPKCNGDGLCIIYRETSRYTDEPAHTKLSYHRYEEYKKHDGDEGSKQDGFITWSYDKYPCPFCKGTGRVYAYIEGDKCCIRAMQNIEEMKTSIQGGYRSSLSRDFAYEFYIDASSLKVLELKRTE